MSSQRAERIEELFQERVRRRESIRCIGQTFVSSLDQPALLELALPTAVDAPDGGRRGAPSGGSQGLGFALDGLLTPARGGGSLPAWTSGGTAEAAAFPRRRTGEGSSGHASVPSATLGDRELRNLVHGVITAPRPDGLFTDDAREGLRSLVDEAALALETSRSTIGCSRSGHQ